MTLRESPYRGQLNLDGVLEIAEKSRGLDKGRYRQEFIQLVRKAQKVQTVVADRIGAAGGNQR
jgi:Ca-activated chloride channel family protein